MTPTVIDLQDMREMAMLTAQMNIVRSQFTLMQSMIVVVGAIKNNVVDDEGKAAVNQLLRDLRTGAESLGVIGPILEDQIESLRRSKFDEIRTDLTRPR
jgi:hypothetical protein